MPITIDGSTGITDADGGTVLSTADLASQAQAQAGTNNTTLMTPLRVAEAISALASAPAFTSAEQTAAASSVFSFAHGLGRIPHHIQVNLRCATTSNGFATNQVILLAGSYDGSTIGHTVYFDATNVYVAITSFINLYNPAAVTLTLSNFRISVRAW